MTKKSPEIAIMSRRVITETGSADVAILVQGGRISQIVSRDQIPAGCKITDYGDFAILPGLVDTHVHVNEPGRSDWEGFESATRAAAAGGVTTLADMPLNSLPVTTTIPALKTKLQAAKKKLLVDCGFWGGLVPENSQHLDSFLQSGVLGVKAFLIDSGIDEFQKVSDRELRLAMPQLARLGLPLLVHAELDTHPSARKSKPSKRHSPMTPALHTYGDYLRSRPRTWENRAIHRLVRLARTYRCRVHIVHLSSADTLPALQEARRSGVAVTMETCPHYLFFSAEDIPDRATVFKCAPPIRESDNRERLWQGLLDGVIDCIVSDHSPCPPQLKLPQQGDFARAWGGIASLQLGLSIVWTEASRRGIGLEQIAKWMCLGPAQLAGLAGRKGAIAPGYDADLTVFDPQASFEVTAEGLYHRHKITPYLGRRLQGRVVCTYLRGQKIYDGQGFAAEPGGQILLRGR